MKKIIAFIGSFNPVTIAHRTILADAVEQCGADEGVFIAVNDPYLKRKLLLKTTPPSPFLLPQPVRREMLTAVTSEYANLSFWGFEMGGASPKTYKTLQKLYAAKQKQYPGEQIALSLLIGADKLRHLPNWDHADDQMTLLDSVVVCERQHDVAAVLAGNPFFAKHRTKFRVLTAANPALQAVSSTEVRRRFFAGEDYADLMDRGPYTVLSRYTPADFPPITLQDVVRANLKYGGKQGLKDANGAVFAANCALFDAWTDPRLGNRAEHRKAIAYAAPFTVTVPEQPTPTVTDCVNADCVDVAKQLLDEGLQPVILNLASRTSPGGGYYKGCHAQEESLCYASTLSQSLYQFGSPKDKHIRESGLTLVPGVYPMDINYGGIYSPTVTFFRYGKDKYYADRETPFDCPVVSVASLSNRQKNKLNAIDERCYFVGENGPMTDEGREIEANKIRTIYRIALANGRDSLVLGAFGCGVYNVLPNEVAALFRDVLAEPEFKNRFKKIVFAILVGKLSARKKNEWDDEGKPTANKKTERDGKFAPFYQTFANPRA